MPLIIPHPQAEATPEQPANYQGLSVPSPNQPSLLPGKRTLTCRVTTNNKLGCDKGALGCFVTQQWLSVCILVQD